MTPTGDDNIGEGRVLVTLDELIGEASLLELQCLDVVKAQRELIDMRRWERRARMALED